MRHNDTKCKVSTKHKKKPKKDEMIILLLPALNQLTFGGDVDGNQWNRSDGKLIPQRRQFGTKKHKNQASIRG